MPAFGGRWPDVGFSIVDADDEVHALILLDELGDEPAELWQMQSCLLDFDLTDDGTFRLSQFGEDSAPEIMGRAYPVLSEALKDQVLPDQPMEDRGEALNLEPESRAIVRKAVSEERSRLTNFRRADAATEIGKDIQGALGGSGVYIDAIVQQVAGQQLKRFKPAKNVKAR
jgi:hypothetical protein